VSPAFDPERLRLAREDAGLRKNELAEAVGVSPAAISQFESGRAAPRQATLSAIALACGFPASFFAIDGRPTKPRDMDEPFFRSLRSTRQWERREAQAKATLVWRVSNELESYVEFPEVAIDAIPVDDDTRPRAIEEIAAEIRRRWGMPEGPAGNIVRLVEARGAIASRVRPRSERVDAFSQRMEGRPVVMLWSTKQDAARSRFDAAHELGHLIMHPDPEPGNKTMERQAHAFAASFLMPADQVADELPVRAPTKRDQGHLLALKRTWGISVAAIFYRARQLNRISPEGHRNAMIRLSDWGWRRDEPGDLGPVEQPTLLRRGLDLVADAAGTPEDRIADALGISIDRLQEICGPGRPAIMPNGTEDRKVLPFRRGDLSDLGPRKNGVADH
jgi:Zn-dependent peptidase ImmA (M78 family)/DNA-binding XRE family transcriptional regulator